MGVRITELDARRDARGSAFGVPLPFANIGECHIATIRPAAVRGNHFHARRREVLVVLYTDRWTLAWDDGQRAFEGSGAVLVEIEPLTAHAVRNDGSADLQILSMGDVVEDEHHPRKLIEPLTRIAGVDGCRRGWIAMVKDASSIETRLCASDEELVALFRECAVVAIDIPIGLADSGPRFCDHHARGILGHRSSSVFPAPLRPLIALDDYSDANRVSRQLQGRGISKQSWAIVDKVKQIDRVLQRHHELRGRVYEIHPEVSFAMWNGGAPFDASKHTDAGIAARRALATSHFGELPPVPKYASENDLLDACAALWTAERIHAGRARELGDAHVDVTGLPMRIVY